MNMYTKLTLNIEQEVVENAKVYAQKQKRSISKLVEDYLASISATAQNGFQDMPLEPLTRELAGSIKLGRSAGSETNYKALLTEALMEKYL
jgi:hypothetical protein